MILSHRHRFVLLATWKSASSTLHMRLTGCNESPYSRFFYYNPFLRRVVHQHITYAEFASLPESQAGYFTGAFVRNPYDRVFSGFLQLQRDVQRHPGEHFPSPWIKDLVMRQVSENFAKLAAAEFEFNKWLALVDEREVYEVGRNASFPLHPAHYWTGIDAQQRVDFVGRLEHFERDFSVFCAKVGVSPGERLNANVSDNAAGIRMTPVGPRYLNHMNAASKSKINTLFRSDFELFDYEMRH